MEIEFKGMTINGDWVVGNYSVLKQDYDKVKKGHYISNKGGSPFAYMVRPETVGQLHNNLTRKAGTKVYVGDIISFDIAEGLGQPASFGYKQNIFNIEFDFFYYTNVKVIGNVHENSK